MYTAEITQLQQHAAALQQRFELFRANATQVDFCGLPMPTIIEVMQNALIRQETLLTNVDHHLNWEDAYSVGHFFHEMMSTMTPIRGYADFIANAAEGDCDFPDAFLASLMALRRVALGFIDLIREFRQVMSPQS